MFKKVLFVIVILCNFNICFAMESKTKLMEQTSNIYSFDSYQNYISRLIALQTLLPSYSVLLPDVLNSKNMISRDVKIHAVNKEISIIQASETYGLRVKLYTLYGVADIVYTNYERKTSDIIIKEYRLLLPDYPDELNENIIRIDIEYRN